MFQDERHAKNSDELDEINKKRETMQDKIDRMLLENELENEDITSLTHALRANAKVDYNLKSLIKSEFVYDIEPELIDESLNDS